MSLTTYFTLPYTVVTRHASSTVVPMGAISTDLNTYGFIFALDATDGILYQDTSVLTTVAVEQSADGGTSWSPWQSFSIPGGPQAIMLEDGGTGNLAAGLYRMSTGSGSVSLLPSGTLLRAVVSATGLSVLGRVGIYGSFYYSALTTGPEWIFFDGGGPVPAF